MIYNNKAIEAEFNNSPLRGIDRKCIKKYLIREAVLITLPVFQTASKELRRIRRMSCFFSSF